MLQGTHNSIEDPRNEEIKIFINGELLPRRDAKISVFDSGYLVGDGVWEGFRLHNDMLVFLDDHIKRLWQGAVAIGMQLPFSPDQLIENIWKTIRVNDMHDNVHIRLMVTRGIKKTPSQDPRLVVSGPNVVIIAEHKVASPDIKEKGITLFTSTIRRGSPDYLDPKLNCHSKLHEVQALIQAINAGADEALMLDVNGFVSTCNSTNFFIIKDDEVWTSTGKYCMNGITRGKVIEICEKHNILCKQKDFSLYEVYSASEAFVTGTFGALIPVVNIDGRVIADRKSGEMTLRLNALYEDLIVEEVKRMK